MSPLRSTKFWRALSRFWTQEESLSVLLVLLVLIAFVFPPFAPRDGRSGVLGAILFSCVLLAGAASAMRERPWAKTAVAVVCVAAVALRWLASVEPGRSVEAWGAATETFALIFLALVVLAIVLRSGTVTRHRIEGAVAAYLLLGLAWAAAFKWVALSNSAAFTGGGLIDGSNQQWAYYSFVNLTTMGYGDITPVDPVARSLATAEALTGQLYLAILISRLVALELQARQAD